MYAPIKKCTRFVKRQQLYHIACAKMEWIDSSISFDLDLMNEGTASIDAGLIVTPVQIIREDGILDAPDDDWSRTLSESGPWIWRALASPVKATVVSVGVGVRSPLSGRHCAHRNKDHTNAAGGPLAGTPSSAAHRRRPSGPALKSPCRRRATLRVPFPRSATAGIL